MPMQSLQHLFVKFEKMCTIHDISRESKHLQLIPKMLSTMDDWLRDDDGLTASKLKAKSLERCTNFPTWPTLSTRIERFDSLLWSIKSSVFFAYHSTHSLLY